MEEDAGAKERAGEEVRLDAMLCANGQRSHAPLPKGCGVLLPPEQSVPLGQDV